MGGIAALGGLGGVPAVFKSGGAAGGWWDPASEGLCAWAAYQAKGAANYAATWADLSGSGNNIVWESANPPGWNAVDGWTFAAAGPNVLNSGFVCASDQSQSILVQFTNLTNLGVLCGSSDTGAKDCWLRPDQGINQLQYANGGAVALAVKLLAGNLGFAGNQGYRDGVAHGGAIGGWAGATIKEVWIGAASTASSSPLSGYIQAFVIYDCVLTAPQVLAVTTAMALL